MGGDNTIRQEKMRAELTTEAFESGDVTASKKAHQEKMPWEEDGHVSGYSSALSGELVDASEAALIKMWGYAEGYFPFESRIHVSGGVLRRVRDHPGRVGAHGMRRRARADAPLRGRAPAPVAIMSVSPARDERSSSLS